VPQEFPQKFKGKWGGNTIDAENVAIVELFYRDY
jgi:hypothetical protein